MNIILVNLRIESFWLLGLLKYFPLVMNQGYFILKATVYPNIKICIIFLPAHHLKPVFDSYFEDILINGFVSI